MKILLFVAAAMAVLQIFAGSAGVEGCSFEPIEACRKCDFSRSYVQYKRNECNHTEYYSCEKTQGKITAHKQACKRCLEFSNEDMGCTIRVTTPGCTPPTETPITEQIFENDVYCYHYGNGPQGDYLQQYAEVLDPATERYIYFYWIVNEFPMKFRCAAGTYFDILHCQCVHCVPDIPCAWDLDSKVFTLNFDNNGAERGTWYNADSSCSVVPNGEANNKALQMPGSPCNIEIPFFQNNEFSEFTLCGWFRADESNLGNEQGLVYNGGAPGDDCHPGTIYIILTSGKQINGGIVTGDAPAGSYDLTVDTEIKKNKDYEVCLRYTGLRLDLAVYDVADQKSTSTSTVASGTTLKNKCNMMFGSSFDYSGVRHFFVGLIDNWSFYRTAVNPYPW